MIDDRGGVKENKEIVLGKRRGEDGAKSEEGWIRRKTLKSDEQEGEEGKA